MALGTISDGRPTVERRFRVAAAWNRGTGGGYLDVAPGTLIFRPGPLTRILSGISGPLVHRAETVRVISARIGPDVIRLVAADPGDAPQMHPPLTRTSRPLASILVRFYHSRDVLDAVRRAGFQTDVERRWLVRPWNTAPN